MLLSLKFEVPGPLIVPILTTLVFVEAFLGKRSWDSMGMEFGSKLHYLPLFAAFGLILNLMIIWILASVNGERYRVDLPGVLQGLSTVPDFRVLLLFFVPSIIFQCVGEEVIFRGWMLNHLRPYFPRFLAAFLTSLVFAIGHLEIDLALFAVDFVVGMALCVIMFSSGGRIWNGVAFHFGFNIISNLTAIQNWGGMY